MTDSLLDPFAVLIRNVIETAPIGIFSYDRQGRITFANRAQLRINRIADDVPVETFIGMSVLDHNPVIIENDLLDPLRRVLQGQPFSLEREAFRTRTDQVISVRIQGVPLTDAEGRITGGLVMVEDITSQVQNQRALRQSEARYRHLLEALPDLILRIDRHHRFIDYEKSSREWYVPPGQFLNRTVDEIMPPDIAEQTKAAIQRVLETHTAQVLEYSLDWDNHTSFYEARLVPDTSDDIIVVIRNITEHKIAEQKIIESERRFRSLAEAMPDMMFRLDREGRYLDFHVPPNAGYFVPKPEDIIGKRIEDVIPAEAANVALPKFFETLHSNTATIVEYSIQEAHGLRHYECRFSPTANQEVIAVVRDITEQRKHERLLKAISETTNLMLDADIPNRDTVDAALEQLGITLSASSILFFEARPSEPPEQSTLVPRGRWVDSRIGPADHAPHISNGCPWPAGLLPWAKQITQGSTIRSTFTFSPDEPFAALTGLSTVSALVVPILAGGTWWGGMFFGDQQPSRVWTQDDESALTLLAANIGGIIQRNRIEFFLRREREQAEILREVGTAITSTLDLAEISRRLLVQIRRVVDFDAASVVFLDQEQIHTVAHTGYDHFGIDSDTIDNLVLHLQEFPLLQEILAARECRSFHNNGQMGFDPVPGVDLSWIRAWMGVPIIAHGESVIGLFLLISVQPNAYQNAQELSPVLKTIAQQAAFAIENAQLYSKLQHRNNELQLLQQAGRAVLSDLKLDEMLMRLAHEMAEIANVTGVIVCRYATDTRSGIVEASVQQSDEAPIATYFAPRAIVDVSSPSIRAALQEGSSLILPHEDLAEAFPNVPLLARAQWVVVIPLRAGDQIRGFVLLCNHSQNHIFRREQITICEALADQVAIMLEQARLFKDLHALERIKSRMINMASHDLRGPLTRLSNALNTLANTLPSPTDEQRQSIDMAGRAVLNLEDMIRKLLSLKRIEEQHRKAEPVVWPDIIQGAVDSQNVDIVARQQTLTLAIEPDLPVTLGDPVQLTHALANLIQNAVKFTPPHGEITIRAYLKDYGGRPCVAVEVQDTGTGIPTDLQEDLFTPFYRAHHEDSPDIPGTGLGLWIVKTAIEDHNGSVYFDSVPQQGSLFGFWVPAD